ncbi:hypothetical protein TTHERM_00529830 (macronuclear) [Tetrahymena thermophila SB210]|uniref:Uncharacterized protein n=1 Tax=Tetrahymena thermophila (strain SB210) TaxID=312017 RepID=I7MCW1_TETTS|nr:hypothetical protein TTHERM_00529830 [Tetrahymena thermophila SB210]EAR85031.2 hypothetical protein TTHERM_00529830 [Tetrahymena thermophila SB210]|eukprot:XP_001032694.2 hypothetical protein TTHERM_00529830 [Tetrahymena thermophila SB210]
MGKKNRRKNNTNNSKVNQGLKAEQQLQKAQEEAQLLKQQQELNIIRGKLCTNSIMDLRQQEFSAEELQMIHQSQKHSQSKQLEQCRATKEQMVQKIIQEGRMNQHIPLHHRYPLQQQQYQIYGQQNIQINDNQMHHYNQYQINRNHHLNNLNSLSQKEGSQIMMIRRFERKQISKSCDDAIKRQNYHNSYDDEEDADCNDIYQTDNQEIQKQQYHVYLPQNELQYQNCDDMEGHDEDEEQIEYDENEEFDCQQNLQIQFCNKRDYYNHYGKKIFQSNNGATEDDQEYEEEDDGDDDEDEDEDEEEEEDDHEEFENGDFRGSYTYDEDNQNLRFIQANILQKNLNDLQLQGNRQQQQLQIKQYQKQLQHQKLQQYLLEQQQLQNAQQGKSKQSNLSHQQQQALQQKQILQQQQLQIFNQVNLQQLQQKQQINQNIQQLNKNYLPSSQQTTHHQFINQNNSYYANGSQNNTSNQNSTANYQNQSQQQKNRGCKTPSTDDNSESFNHSARTNSFQKNTKQSSQSLKKSSVERVAVYGKPKSESEKKLAPSHNSFISQEANLALLSQQKFKYLKDEHLDLDQILNKIYFEEYTYDELKEFVIPALREIQNINNFFDILFNSIRIYAEDVKQKIINNIKQINQACSGIAESQNRIFEISEFEQIINKNFHKQSEAFIRITNQIYGQYQAVEKYSKQTEKIVYLYINHFIEKNRSIRFNCEDLHRRIFIFFVFADPQINNYLEAKINYFRSKGLNGSKYHDCFHQLNKMHDILIRKNQYIPSEEHPINIEIYEKETCDEEEEEESQNDDRYYQGQPHISQQSTMNQKLLKKRNQKKSKNMQLKKLQQQFAQGQYNDISDYAGQKEFSEQINGLCEYINTLDDQEIKKKKKKKKKNKSAANAAANKDEEQNQSQHQNGEEEQPRDSSTEKIKKSEGKKKGPNCHMNEELEQFQKRLEESYKNLKEHQKIQPIIAENWILKIKERYAKLKVRLNK